MKKLLFYLMLLPVALLAQTPEKVGSVSNSVGTGSDASKINRSISITNSHIDSTSSLRISTNENTTNVDSLKTGQSLNVDEVPTAYVLFYDPTTNITTYGDTSDLGATGSGDVYKVGTPLNNEVTVWTGDGTVDGTDSLTFDGATLDITGDITVSGTVDGIDIATQDATYNTMLQDSLGWFIVDKSYGDGITNATAHIQSVIDAAGSGKMYIPPGQYLVDSLYVEYSLIIEGAAWDFEKPGGVHETTNLKANLNKPILTIGQYSSITGGHIKNIHFSGIASSDSTNQDGIRIMEDGDITIEKNYFLNLGGYGINFDQAGGGIWGPQIVRNKIQLCQQGGIYVVGSSGGVQINAVDIYDNHIQGNLGDGIEIFGTAMNVFMNTIEGNTGAGVLVSGATISGVNASASSINIKDNYMELNTHGSVVMQVDYSSPYYHNINNVNVSGNYFYDLSTTLTDGYDACITLERESGSSAVNYFNDIIIGQNTYNSNGCYAFNGNDVCDNRVSLTINRTSGYTSEYVGMEGVSIIFKGQGMSGRSSIAPTVSGITEDMLSPFVRIFGMGGNIDITSDPQIADGLTWGQTLMIYVNDSGNTLTLDDGAGLDLSAQWVGNTGDIILLVYYGDWYEVSRSDN